MSREFGHRWRDGGKTASGNTRQLPNIYKYIYFYIVNTRRCISSRTGSNVERMEFRWWGKLQADDSTLVMLLCCYAGWCRHAIVLLLCEKERKREWENERMREGSEGNRRQVVVYSYSQSESGARSAEILLEPNYYFI